MKLETIALIAFCVIGLIAAIGYGALIYLGTIATFPYGLPGLALIAIFVFIAIAVVYQRLTNSEDTYYERNIHE